MTTCSDPLVRRRLRAPREDRTVLVDPPLERLESTVRDNVALRNRADYDVQGRWLSDLSCQARRDLIDEARRYTVSYRDARSAEPRGEGLIFLAGHQPQLFHPGVWFKNVALGTLAARCGATAVNLLIDSDTVKSTSLRVPGGSLREPRLELIPLDAPGLPVPYEQRRVQDPDTFADFGRRAAERIAPLVPDPMVTDYWPMVCERLRETDNLGLCVAQSRHQWEARWGLNTLELPQSRICQGEPFCWFVAHLLAQLPRLHAVYNEVVEAYRRANKVRNSAHPVPNLGSQGRWLEAPFWIWTTSNPQRRGVWVLGNGDQIRLSDRQGLEIELPLSVDGDASRAVQRLVELQAEGVKLRSRALVTTLWARIALGDLFLHGIGGGKYDQVTDALVRRFLGLKPPQFMVLSATLRLPVQRPGVEESDIRRVNQLLRGLRYHPEKALPRKVLANSCSCPDSPAALAAKKHRWIQTPKTPQNARQRHQEIEQANLGLQPWVEPQRAVLRRRRDELEAALRAEAVLAWREYAFCLHPEATLQDFLFGVLPKVEQMRSDG